MQSSGIENIAERDIPPAPWQLQGSACVSLWRLPTEALPDSAPGIRFVDVAGHTLVATLWARYAPGGTLSYDELAVAVMARGAGLFNPACSIINIWVSDPLAAAGGTRLWAIPKELANFAGELSALGRGAAVRATDQQGNTLASLQFESRFDIPGTLPLQGFIIQSGAGGPIRTRCAVKGKARSGRALWDFPASGPLAFLHGRTPFVSLRMDSLQGRFGL
ncbi:acetoacetate decarboxylase family protein [Pseudomonas profundi]|uniref:acetoacetate decarboxylase family protein n=1 Tax=Pseudomonas profundi TaxID=1981513 RepID=UPI0016808922|nr:acetoacetate decarboxylase family protein [Pseudomonas profundi]